MVARASWLYETVVEAPPTIELPAAAPPPAASDSAAAAPSTEPAAATDVPVGLVVPAHVLTPEELRRQDRERRVLERRWMREALSQNLVYAADSLIESFTPVSLFLMFCGFWCFGHVTLSILLKQAATPATERFQSCITNHVLVQTMQFFALAVSSVLGSHQMTITMLGRTNETVQPKRICWLLFLCIFESMVIMPLCGPEVAPFEAATTPARCHVAQPLPPEADQEQRLSALLMYVTFFQAAYLTGLSFAIFCFLSFGLLAPRPVAFMVPLITLYTCVSTLYLQYLIYFSRWAQSIFVNAVTLFDKCMADAVWVTVNTAMGTPDAIVGDHDVVLKAPGGIYGPRVAWSLEELECRPPLVWIIGSCMALSLLVLVASACVHY